MRFLAVHLLETDALRSDGVAVHLRRLERGFERLGHRLDLVSFSDTPGADRETYRRAVAEAYRERGKAAGVAETFRRRRDLVAGAVRARLATTRYDAILAQGPLEFSAVPALEIPVVLTLHAFRSDDELRKGNLAEGSAEREWFRTEERKVLERARVVVAVSSEYLDRARERGARPRVERVVPNGIDAAEYGPGPDLREVLGLGERNVCGFLGRLSRQKGPDLLIDAFSRIAGDGILLVGGDGEMRGACEEQVRETGLSPRVRFAGEVTDVPAFLRTLDVAVLPSRWEGLPFTLLEFGAAGLPVVAAAVGGVAELIRDGENGLLVSPEDPEGLTRAIRLCLDDREAARSRGEALRRLVETRHSLERMAEGYVLAVEGESAS